MLIIPIAASSIRPLSLVPRAGERSNVDRVCTALRYQHHCWNNFGFVPIGQSPRGSKFLDRKGFLRRTWQGTLGMPETGAREFADPQVYQASVKLAQIEVLVTAKGDLQAELTRRPYR
jgi:hypothetical protein